MVEGSRRPAKSGKARLSPSAIFQWRNLYGHTHARKMPWAIKPGFMQGNEEKKRKKKQQKKKDT